MTPSPLSVSGESEFTKGRDIVTCPDCGGDGYETCHNPDHGFISAMGGEIGRLGCPCCGHDERHKVKKGGACETCSGAGVVAEPAARLFCEQMEYDFEDVMSYLPDAASLSTSGDR